LKPGNILVDADGEPQKVGVAVADLATGRLVLSDVIVAEKTEIRHGFTVPRVLRGGNPG